MDGQQLTPEHLRAQQIQILRGQVQELLTLSLAFNNINLSLAPNMGIVMSTVSRYESVELTDESGNLTGKTVPLLFMASGSEVELTPEQNKIFKPVWDEKTAVDRKLFSYSSALRRELFPDTPAQLQA